MKPLFISLIVSVACGSSQETLQAITTEEQSRPADTTTMSTPPIRPPFRTWMTVTIGTTHGSVFGLGHALEQAGVKIDDRAKDLLFQIGIYAIPKQYELVAETLAGFGFYYGATPAQVSKYVADLSYTHKLRLGGCPAEVGPQLRLQYRDQSSDLSGIVIDMMPEAVPINVEPQDRSVFYLTYYDNGRGVHEPRLESIPVDRTLKGTVAFIFCRYNQ